MLSSDGEQYQPSLVTVLGAGKRKAKLQDTTQQNVTVRVAEKLSRGTEERKSCIVVSNCILLRSFIHSFMRSFIH